MSKVILVTGGARSGKSNFAEKLCKDQNNNTAYIATSIPFDDEMKERVKKHKESRPQNWKTYEIYKDIYTIINDISKEHKTVILDCVTLLVNNLMFTYEIDIDNSTQEEINELETYIKKQVEKLGNLTNKIIEANDNNDIITIDDFSKIKLRTAKVLEADKIKKSKKLLKLKVKVGKEEKQILAGIAEYYEPEYLIGKTVVSLLANQFI